MKGVLCQFHRICNSSRRCCQRFACWNRIFQRLTIKTCNLLWTKVRHIITINVIYFDGVTLSRSWLPMDTYIATFGSSFVNILAGQSFLRSPEVDTDAVEAKLEFVRWLMMPSRMAQSFHNVSQCFYDHFWFAKFSYVCVHQGSISGQCDASISK